MNELQKLKDLGVQTLSVQNHEATAVNPYDAKDCVCPKEECEHLCNNCVLFFDFAQATYHLPPLPCPSVPDGTYEIDRFRGQLQYMSPVTKRWTNTNSIDIGIKNNIRIRTILVLSEPVAENNNPAELLKCEHCGTDTDCDCKEPVAETKFPEDLDWGTLPTKEEAEAGNLKRRAIQAENKRLNEVAEKPEGETFNMEKQMRFISFANSMFTKPSPPEAEPVASAEEIRQGVIEKYRYAVPKPSQLDIDIEAMEEYASLRVAQALKNRTDQPAQKKK